ncbi:MAG: disulfide bond formation protein DsbA [Actinomycetia bacterium]|nr:disulfide bond formation protein DsbA [Actinomycetes bacterium]
MTVEMWFDPACPWAWITSRWLLEVQQVRDVEVVFKVMSLGVLNEGRDLDPDYRRFLDTESWIGARASAGVAETGDPELLARFYTALGTRYHQLQEPRAVETVRAALADVGADPTIADRAQTDAFDASMRASHAEAIAAVGDEVGTPVVRVNGMALFGPVLSPAPKGEQAGELFDGFVKMTAYPGFFELKRTRTVGPILD